MTAKITLDDWTKALGDIGIDIQEDDPSASTINELKVLWGCARSTAEVRIRALIEAGKAITVSKRVPRQHGSYPVTAYRLLPRAKKKKSDGSTSSRVMVKNDD